MRYALLAVILVILASCSGKHDLVLPRGLSQDSIIPKEEMVMIIADMHVLEAIFQMQRNRVRKSMDPVSARYSQLFSKYKISKKRFDLNIAYYQSDPEVFLKIYDEVVKEMDRRKKLQRLE